MNGDGIDDIISGSYSPGNIYIYCGNGKGGYLEPKLVKDEKGKDLAIESASAPAVIDWNGDGKPDLIVGFIAGNAKLLINKGNFVFGSVQDVKAGGAVISGSNMGTAVADWDSDGTLDLLMGFGGGQIMFYKGTKAAEGYEFAKGVELVSGTNYQAQKDRSSDRPKMNVADWNGDGKPDLLVGDFSSEQKEPKNLTAAQKKRRDELQKKQSDLSQSFTKAYQKTISRVLKKHGYKDEQSVPAEKKQEFQQEVMKELQKDEDYKTYNAKMQAIYKDLAPLQGTYETNGYVWVYLRK